mgnify:CR=1 FL=1
MVADLNIGILFFPGNVFIGRVQYRARGWASNNKYALLGCPTGSIPDDRLRSIHGIIFDGVVMLTGSFNACRYCSSNRKLDVVHCNAAVGLYYFFIAGIAETHRLPFWHTGSRKWIDAGYHAEYSGMKFGMFFIGEYLGITLISAMTAWYCFRRMAWPFIFATVGCGSSLKTFVFIGLFILLRAALARPRYDQLMEYGWKWFCCH